MNGLSNLSSVSTKVHFISSKVRPAFFPHRSVLCYFFSCQQSCCTRMLTKYTKRFLATAHSSLWFRYGKENASVTMPSSRVALYTTCDNARHKIFLYHTEKIVEVKVDDAKLSTVHYSELGILLVVVNYCQIINILLQIDRHCGIIGQYYFLNAREEHQGTC